MDNKMRPSRWIMAEKKSADGNKKMQMMSCRDNFGNILIKTLYSATTPKNTRKLKKSVLIRKLLKLNRSKTESILASKLVLKLFQYDFESSKSLE